MRVLDFDGTLVNLQIDWSALRGQLGLASIQQIWSMPERLRKRHIVQISAAEAYAAKVATIDWSRLVLLCRSPYLVFTNNSEISVHVFLQRIVEERSSFPVPVAVVGRESLNGSKLDFSSFATNLLASIEQAFGHSVDLSKVAYYGDSEYEINYAKFLGINSHFVTPLNA